MWEYESKYEAVFRQMIEFCRKIESEESGAGIECFYEMTEDSKMSEETEKQAILSIKNFNQPYETIMTNG